MDCEIKIRYCLECFNALFEKLRDLFILFKETIFITVIRNMVNFKILYTEKELIDFIQNSSITTLSRH